MQCTIPKFSAFSFASLFLMDQVLRVVWSSGPIESSQIYVSSTLSAMVLSVSLQSSSFSISSYICSKTVSVSSSSSLSCDVTCELSQVPLQFVHITKHFNPALLHPQAL